MQLNRKEKMRMLQESIITKTNLCMDLLKMTEAESIEFLASPDIDIDIDIDECCIDIYNYLAPMKYIDIELNTI